MRFLVMVKATKEWDGEAPAAAMGAFNDALARDGVMLAAEGLQPTSKGARISYAGPRPVVTDGPFTETKELVAGFWLVQARTKEELIERYLRCPFERGESIEIRQLFEAEDFPGIELKFAHKGSQTPNARP